MEFIIDNLIELVMNEREAKVYYTLLKHNNSTTIELSRLSRVEKIETIEILNFLTAKGFCYIKYLKNDIIYSVIEPEIAFSEVIEKQRKKLCERESTVLSLSKIFIARLTEA